MAQVTVDISEYDGLREAKARAEKEVEELKETIKDLKKGAKVIFQTKYLQPGDNLDEIKRCINYRCGLSYVQAMSVNHVLDSFLELKQRDTYQYINFKDVEAQVEAGLSEQKKKELEASIAYYKKAAQELEKKSAGLEEEYQKKKEAYENASKFFLEKKDKEIKDLQYKIAELSKSKDERIAELIKQIDEAGVKLSELRGDRKNWFNRIFK